MKTKEINNLLKKYRSYIYKIAGNYAKDKTLLEDLVQECSIGFIKAAQNFDANKGIQFKTYAFYWMRGYILKYMRGSLNAIRIPTHLYQYINEYKESKAKLFNLLGRDPTDKEIEKYSKRLNKFRIEKIKNLDNLIPLSLDSYIDENNKSLNEFISDTIEDNFEIDSNLQREEIYKYLSRLSDKQADVIKLHYGLNKNRSQYRFTEIGKLFGCSSENVRQLEKKAIKNLRRLMKKNK